jgi:hypothetical protein
MSSTITQVSTDNFDIQIYDQNQTSLIPTIDIDTSLNTNSVVEFYIYDLNKNIVISNPLYNNYTVFNDPSLNGLSKITISPEDDLIQNGIDQGSYITYYNFLDTLIGSPVEPLFISEISSDRTELRLDSILLSNDTIVDSTQTFLDFISNSQYFVDFYLNFGENNLLLSNNIQLDNTDPNNPTILIKLYKPLPIEFTLNSVCWVVNNVEEPIAYRIDFEESIFQIVDTLSIKGPNFNLDIKDQVNNSTQPLSYADILLTSLSSSQNNINSLLEEKEIDINVDYTDFNNFIHFSSAQTRLENFYYKIQLIENYSESINVLNNTTGSVSGSISTYENNINTIITNFDDWEYYLYYGEGVYSWPKSTNVKPYVLYPSTSNEVLTWFGTTNEYSPLYGGLILSASLFDNTNPNQLLKSIPEYLREDNDNHNYELFVDMVAQHYDNIWVYHNEITNKYNNDNRLEVGISKDIVADGIREFGIKLYQNSFTDGDLYSSLLGITPNGSSFPFPNITGSLPTPSGFEYIDTLISASNDNIPLDDINKSIYKRLYHNLPYLLKSKGTLPGLRALITSYGIPDTILRINEYGGKDKVNSNDWDYWKNEFNYAFDTSNNNFISSSFDLNTEWNSPNDKASSVLFRFKTPGLDITPEPSQSLWYADGGVALTLTYTGSAYTSASYSGSIVDPYNEYATLTFHPSNLSANISASVYLPFYNGDWWSVMVKKDSGDYTLHVQNKTYEGGDNGTTLGFNESSSVTFGDYYWNNSSTSYFPVSFSIYASTGYDVVSYDTAIYDGTGSLAGSYTAFSGSYQEIRYYTTAITEDVFSDFTMNPYSIEGNSINTAADELAFRASLGGELYTGSTSIHPMVTGSWGTRHSFNGNSNFYFDDTPIFTENREYFFYDQPISGIKNPVSDKIRLEDNIFPSGNTLSPYRVLNQNLEISSSYTPNTNLLEVAFSPQNEINDDIMSHVGYFNIGDYIGDPILRASKSTSYPALDTLRKDYFQKYTSNYGLKDFVRLIKFFDNSLFKMIRDFIPARTSLASGIVIKQHLLERNKYPQPQLSYSNELLTGSVKPQWNNYEDGTIENISGGAGGVVNHLNVLSNVSQSWNITIPYLSGSLTKYHDSQSEFYDGEYSGSNITVTTQSLNSGSNNPPMWDNQFSQSLFNNIEDARPSIKYQDVDYTQGAALPVNFDLLISGSASKAPIQDSNYSLKRHSNPRYNGTKNTTEKLNIWTTSSVNEGNYGKTPSAENLKTAVAYCDSIGGWPPERIDASSANIIYLIQADGTITKPDTSVNSLETTQGNFISGERVVINYSNTGSDVLPVGGTDQNLPSREIIRGGSRIEPVLYNQIGWIPPTFTSSIEFVNQVLPVVGNYEGSSIFKGAPGTPTFSGTNYSALTSASLIPIPLDILDTYVTLTISVRCTLENDNTDPASSYGAIVQIVSRDPSSPLSGGDQISSQILTSITYNNPQSANFTGTINSSNASIHAGRDLYLIVGLYGPAVNTPVPRMKLDDSSTYPYSFTVTQSPAPGTQPALILNSNLWVSSSNGTYSMYTTQSDAVSMFNTNLTHPTWYMKDISGSGYNPILTPWGVERGDVFRFEGDESKTYMVNYAETGSVGGNPSINVYFGSPIPSSLNINQYSLIRYIDDASKVIIKGYRPNKSVGPYIIRPEFVVPELDRGIDTYITQLSEKGLI